MLLKGPDKGSLFLCASPLCNCAVCLFSLSFHCVTFEFSFYQLFGMYSAFDLGWCGLMLTAERVNLK